MIGYLKGIIINRKPNYLILMVNNVGYEIFISFQTYQKLNEINKEEELFIYTIHKEDTFNLYGFKTEEEKELFKAIISVSGIGPKMGLAILSKVDTQTFKKALSQQNIDLLTSIGGIGKKRAEKLIFELKEKFKGLYDAGVHPGEIMNNIQQDAVLGLEGLGYSRNEAVSTIRKIPFDDKMTLEDLIKKALSS